MIGVVEFLLLAGIVVSALLALVDRDLLSGVIYLAVMSMLLSVEFYLLQAPDVAIAEAAIGAGLSTAIFVMAVKKTVRWENEA